MANHNDPVEAAKRGMKKQDAQALPDGVKEHVPELEPLQTAAPPETTSGYFRPEDVAAYKPLPKQAPVVDVIRVGEAAPPPTISTRLRLLHDWRGSLYGQMIHLKAGEILDKGHYGEEGIQRLIDGGLRYETIKEE